MKQRIPTPDGLVIILLFFVGALLSIRTMNSFEPALVIYGVSAADESAAAIPRGGVTDRATDRILVKFKKSLPEQAQSAILARYNLSEKSNLPHIGVKIISIPSGTTPEAAIEGLKQNEKNNVDFAEVDALLEPDYIPSDPLVGSEWHISKIVAPNAWDSAKGSGVTIAILDTGIDCTHPDLAANCVPGRNVVSNNSDTGPVHPHGTYTAGTAAAVGDNLNQMAGVTYTSKIMPVRITNDSTGYAYWSDIANGVIWAADHGAKVVTNSYGSHVSSTVQSAASYLNSKGGLMFNSAMNSATLMTQDNPPSMVTVSATDQNDSLASFSNYGTPIDLSAPGVSVMCTTPGGGIGSCSGTSFSAPIAAATAALVWSVKPSLSPSQVESILKSTAQDLGSTGWDQYYGWGRIHAGRAVQAALGTASDTTPPSAPTGLGTSTSDSSSVTLSWTASTDNVAVGGYAIFRNNTKIGTTANVSYTDTSVTAGATYTYVVSAYDSSNNVSPSSNTLSVTIPMPPQTLSVSTVSAITQKTSATVSWNTNVTSVGTVYYGTSAGNLTLTGTDTTKSTAHSILLTGLDAKKQYYYQVRATTPDSGLSANSGVQSFRTRNR